MGREFVGRGWGGKCGESFDYVLPIRFEMVHQPTQQRCEGNMLDLSGVQRIGPTVCQILPICL